MRFAFLIFKYFPFGGVQRDMLRIARELLKKGHKVDIFTISWEGDLPEAGINVHTIPVNGLFNFQRYQRFINIVNEKITNLKNTSDTFNFVFGFNRAEGLDAYFAADPCLIDKLQISNKQMYRFLPRYNWFLKCEKAIFSPLSNCDVLYLSDNEKFDFQKWYQTNDSRFHFVPPFLSRERLQLQDKAQMRAYLRQTFNFEDQDFVFLLVGSGFYMKGLDRAIFAMASLPKDTLKNIRLVAVGQDNPKPFIKLAKKLGVGNHLTISKGRSDIPWLMQGSDSYIHPAYRENTGLVLLEALASGLPVLATATCGYAYHIEQANAGTVAAAPFDQNHFNELFRQMIVSDQHASWSKNGIDYTKKIMSANDGSAEANILESLSASKNNWSITNA